MRIKKLDFSIDFRTPDFIVRARKLFGEMQKRLKDPKAVGFKISVTVHWDDGEESETISLERERSELGGWNSRFPRDQDSRALASPVALRKGLSRAERFVRSYIVKNALDEEWSEMEAALRASMKSGVSVDTLEYCTEIPVLAIARYGYAAHLYAPVMATAYVIEGTEALAENNLEHASYCLEHGLYWSSPETLIPDPSHRFSERARTGGYGKAGNYDPVKIKVAELLKELEPDGGWISDQDAVERVADELAREPYLRLIDDCGLEYYNLARTIGGWIREKPEEFWYGIKPGA